MGRRAAANPFAGIKTLKEERSLDILTFPKKESVSPHFTIID